MIASPPWLSARERIVTAIVSMAALALLLVASCLEPSPFGIGTHTQMGLPACSWPTALHIPCPSCGMTTAFAHAARGDLLASFMAQPFGALLALATAMVAVVGSFAAITGSRVLTLFTPLAGKWGAAIAVAALLAAWAYKIFEYRSAVL